MAVRYPRWFWLWLMLLVTGCASMSGQSSHKPEAKQDLYQGLAPKVSYHQADTYYAYLLAQQYLRTNKIDKAIEMKAAGDVGALDAGWVDEEHLLVGAVIDLTGQREDDVLPGFRLRAGAALHLRRSCGGEVLRDQQDLVRRARTRDQAGEIEPREDLEVPDRGLHRGSGGKAAAAVAERRHRYPHGRLGGEYQDRPRHLRYAQR